MDRQRLLGLLAGLGAASIWGGLYVVSKVVLAHIPPFSLLLLRLLLGGTVIGLIAWRAAWQRISREEFFDLLLLGFTGYGVSLALQFTGTHLSTAANGAVITAATPAFVFIFARGLLGERIPPRRWVALAVATVGVLLVVDLSAARLSPTLFKGNLLLVGAALTWALHSVLVRRASARLNTLMVSFWAVVGGLPFAIPAAGWELAQDVTLDWTPGVIAGVLYIGVISTALAMYLWNSAFRLVDAGAASLTFFAQPLVGTLLGVLFLGESLSLSFVLGGVLIALGLWLSSRAPGKPRQVSED